MTDYGDGFFDYVRDTSRGSAEVMVPIILDLVHAESVVDIGCGSGEWLDVFAQQGVDDYLGIDGAYGDYMAIPEDHFVAQDLMRGWQVGRTFDLAISLEVAEHLPAERANAFVHDLVELAPTILFSAAVPGQGGLHHVNEQRQSWWAARFAQHGYAARDVVRPLIWEDDRVATWYKQNTILYVRDGEPTTTLLDVLHPAFRPSPPSLRRQLAQLPSAIRQSIGHRARRLRSRWTR